MARIVLSGLLQDIRGSIGASTFSAWKGITYMRNKAITVSNPQTMSQEAVRANLAISVASYRALTEIQKALWEEYAQQQKNTNSADEVVGDFGIIPQAGKTQSGFNAYIGVNQVLFSAGFARKAVPPAIPQPDTTQFLLLTGTAATIHIEYTAVTLKPGTTQKLEIWLKGWWKGAHAYITQAVVVPTPPAIPDPINILTIRKGWGDNIQEVPFTQIVPCDVFVQGIIARSDGYRSVPTALRKVTVIA